MPAVFKAFSKDFLSTPSARRATGDVDRVEATIDISIHALREEGDDLLAVDTSKYKISIHALREEGDRASSWAITTPSNFYPRPPRGGRPNCPTTRHR